MEHRIGWQCRARASTALEHAHARTRTHRRFQEPRILVSGLAVVRVQRRNQSEEDACAGRRAGNYRKRCRHDGGRELERQRALCSFQDGDGGPGLFVVPAAGGVAKRVDGSAAEGRASSDWPEFLPGSEDFLVLAAVGESRGVGNLPRHAPRRARGRSCSADEERHRGPLYAAGGGRILFVRNDNLYAQTLNRTARTLEGEPELIQQRVASSPSFYVAHFSVSRTGVVAWRPGTAGLSQVTIFDREGKEIGTAGSPTVVQTLRLAPDETRLLVGFNATAWLLEPGRPGRQQLEQGDSGHAVVAGRVQAPRDEHCPGNDTRIVERSVAGQGPVRELAKPSGMWRLEDISPDGKTLLLSRGPLDTTVFSDDIRIRPAPAAASAIHQVVSAAARDVDAARRLVESRTRCCRPATSPSTTFCWLPPLSASHRVGTGPACPIRTGRCASASARSRPRLHDAPPRGPVAVRQRDVVLDRESEDQPLRLAVLGDEPDAVAHGCGRRCRSAGSPVDVWPRVNRVGAA